jgi:hypothetical protein
MLVENSSETAIGGRISPKNTKVDRISPENNKDQSEPITKHQGQSDLAAKHQRLIGSHRKTPRPVESHQTTTTGRKSPQNTKLVGSHRKTPRLIESQQLTIITFHVINQRVSPELLLLKKQAGTFAGDRQIMLEIPKIEAKPNRNPKEKYENDLTTLKP